jgi:hypothetical protein
VTSPQARWVTLALCQAEVLIGQFVRRLVLALQYIEIMEPSQHRKVLRGLPHPLAQLHRAGEGLSHFRGRIPLRDRQRSAERELQSQLPLGTLHRVQ